MLLRLKSFLKRIFHHMRRGTSQGRSSAGGQDAEESAPLLSKVNDEKKEDPLDDGALEPGGEVDVLAFNRIGYLCQYFAVGLVSRAISSMAYGLYICYLNVPSYVNSSQQAIIDMAWSLKIVFALISDSCPLFGLRRKPYMAFGWVITSACLATTAWFMPLPPAYYCFGSDGQYNTSVVCNQEASKEGSSYAALMSLATCGYMFADVSADALTVQYARRESRKRRGSTQTLAYLVRELGAMCALLIVGFLMNGPEYNGSFSWGLSFNFICGVLAMVVAVQIPISLYLIDEPLVDPSKMPSCGTACSRVHTMLSSGATFEVVLYMFLGGALGGIGTTAGAEITRLWAGVQNLQSNLFRFASSLIFVAGLWLTRRYFLGASWRKMILITTIVMSVIDAPFTFLTIFGVVRNQYFFLGEAFLVSLPRATSFVVSIYVIVELAEEGGEGLAYGVLTTIGNLSGPLSTVLSNYVFGHFFFPSLSDSKNYVDDTPEFRKEVAWSYVLSYVFGFSALLLLPLLPDQKEETQERKRTRPRSQYYTLITCLIIALALGFSLTLNILSVIPSTMCLEIAGGEGC